MQILSEAKEFFFNFFAKRYPGLTGLEVAPKQKANRQVNNFALVFHVIRKDTQLPPEKRIPSELKYRGITIVTDIVEADYATPEIARPGNSISRIKDINGAGSVGAKVSNVSNSNMQFLLTNYHVAALDLIEKRKYQYIFPEELANRQIMVPAQKENPVANDFIGAIMEGRLTSFFDIALIQLTDPSTATNEINNQIKISGALDIWNQKQFEGKEVFLCGAVSGISQPQKVISER
jgi:hypothetical protein